MRTELSPRRTRVKRLGLLMFVRTVLDAWNDGAISSGDWWSSNTIWSGIAYVDPSQPGQLKTTPRCCSLDNSVRDDGLWPSLHTKLKQWRYEGWTADTPRKTTDRWLACRDVRLLRKEYIAFIHVRCRKKSLVNRMRCRRLNRPLHARKYFPVSWCCAQL